MSEERTVTKTDLHTFARGVKLGTFDLVIATLQDREAAESQMTARIALRGARELIERMAAAVREEQIAAEEAVRIMAQRSS